jgi:inosine-uridine nucleoside N-ribohydrolase
VTDLVLLGPCTNAAVALSLDPGIARLVQTVTVMGGSSYAKGNTTKGAEFNFHADPESARAVIEGFGAAFAVAEPGQVPHPSPLTIVTWDACLAGALPWTVLDEARAEKSRAGALGEWLTAVCGAYEGLCRRPATGKPNPESATAPAAGQHVPVPDEPFSPCDAYAVACAIDPETYIADSSMARVEIETGAGPARGTMLVDWYGRSAGGGIARVVHAVHPAAFEQAVRKMLSIHN